MYKILTLLPIVFFSSFALSGSIDEKTLQRIEQELDRVKKENAVMRKEIEELKALQKNDNWMTEERSSELRDLVSSVLKDADGRTSFEDDGIMAGWSNGFFLNSRDGRFRMNLSGLLQARYLASYFSKQQSQYSNVSGNQSGLDRYRGGFEMPRALLRFSGHVFGKKNKYFFEFGRQNNLETVGSQSHGGASGVAVQSELELRRAWLNLSITEDWSARIGRMRSPYSIEWMIDPDLNLGVDRSLISMKLGLSDAVGLQAVRERENDRLQFMVSTTMTGGFFNQLVTGSEASYFYNKGAFGTPALDRYNTDWTLMARYSRKHAGAWSQFNQFTSPPEEEFALASGLGAYYLRSQEESGTTSTDPQVKEWGLTADVMGKWGGLSGYGAVYYNGYQGRSGNPSGDQKVIGAIVQGSVYSDPKNEFFTRFEYADVHSDDDLSAAYLVDPEPKSDLSLLTVGWNHYIDGQDLKISTEIGWSIAEISQLWVNDHLGWRNTKDDADQMVLRTQFQLRF